MTYGSWLPRVWRSEIRRISIFGVFLSRGRPPGLARRVVGGRGSWSLPGSMLAFVNGVALVAAGGCRSTSDRCTWLYCSRGRAGLRPRGGRYRENDAALRGPQAGCRFGKRQVIHRLSGRGGGVAKALIRQIRSGAAAPWHRAARASCRQVNAPSVWALTSSSKEASLMCTVAMDRWRLVGLSARRAPWSSTLVGRTRQPVQAPPHSPRMVGECGPVASVSGRIAVRSSTLEQSSGKASIGVRVRYVAARWRRRSVSALLQVQAAVFRGSESSGERRAAGADVLSARCPRLPLVVSSTGAGGWAKRTSRPRGGACPRDSCSGRMNGQCTAVAVGQYSTLRWRISASSPGSWLGAFGS